MTDLERRMAWPGAQDAILQASWVEMTDWPDALTPDQIGALYARKEDGTSNLAARDELASFLQNEIDQGRIGAITVTQVSRSFEPISFWDTKNPPLTFQTIAITASNCARALAGVVVGKYLAAWLAPYVQHSESEHVEEEPAGLTPMKRAAIINSLRRRYPSLESDFNRPADWVQGCSTGKRGEYYLEKVKAACLEKWGDGDASAGPVATIRTHKMRA